MSATVALVSLGCPKNLVDSQALLGFLEQAGFVQEDDVEAAEVVIVNTCAFIEPAQEEAVDAILDLAALKQKSCRALIVTGCLSQRYGADLLDELTEVDAVLTVGAVPRIVEAVQASLAGKRGYYDAPLEWVYDGTTPRIHTGPEWLAYLKIADGCDHQCAFCTIPSIRGHYRSVSAKQVVAQHRNLVEAGVHEVCLIAQDSTTWGRDLNPRGHLTNLLDELLKVDFDGWLRLLYLHPTTLDEAVIEQICTRAPLVPYFDIPLQHASQEILRRMGRSGDAEQYLALIEKIRRYNPNAAIRTTFIVGFPGETDEDFEALLEFVTAARMDRMSCFRYWPEDGTRAADMPDQVPLELADERLDELMLVQEDISLAANERFIGRPLKVLAEGPIERSKLWTGRTFRDAPEVDGEVKIEVPEGFVIEPGQFVPVMIDKAEIHDLRGHIIVPE